LVPAWALSTPSETPRCSDQLNDSSATHATVKVAIAVRFKATFMDFLSIASRPTLKRCVRDQLDGMNLAFWCAGGGLAAQTAHSLRVFVNLETAIGLDFPAALLSRADELTE
jgi:hypothetical protein